MTINKFYFSYQLFGMDFFIENLFEYLQVTFLRVRIFEKQVFNTLFSPFNCKCSI